MKQFSIVRYYGAGLKENNPRQTNRADCGIFVMIYAELLSDENVRMFTFDQQEDMNRFRLMIVALSIQSEEIIFFCKTLRFFVKL